MHIRVGRIRFSPCGMNIDLCVPIRQFAMMETVITALSDEFQIQKRHKHGKMILTAVICIVLFLVGLPQCSKVCDYCCCYY